jgi:hypothetical protein
MMMKIKEFFQANVSRAEMLGCIIFFGLGQVAGKIIWGVA